MKDYMRAYEIVLDVKGPVYVGSGKQITKKDYVINRDNNSVDLLDIDKVYINLKKKCLSKQFEEFMMNSALDIETWFSKNNVKASEISNWIKYSEECGDRISNVQRSKLQIMECVKDSYGKPYIPGSTLKGMLRTALLSREINKNSVEFDNQTRQIEYAIPKYSNKNNYLKRESEELENISFKKLVRNEKRRNAAVNDILSGLIVGDSEPISVDNLVLCQKIDVTIDGKENKLNILRECIRPGTKIKFKLSIDTTLCELSKSDIEEALEINRDVIYDNFISKFSVADNLNSRGVWIGGGSGYLSKTVLYSLFSGKVGVKNVQKIFEITKVPEKHGHFKDVKLGVSPHMIKCTRYMGKLLQIGLCEFIINEI